MVQRIVIGNCVGRGGIRKRINDERCRRRIFKWRLVILIFLIF